MTQGVKINQIETGDISEINEIPSSTISQLSGIEFNFSVVPIGLIIPFNDTSIPTGWTRFTAADDKHLVAAGSTYSVGQSGGNNSISGITSSSAGSHNGAQANWEGSNESGSGGSLMPDHTSNFSSGSHSHSDCSADVDLGVQKLLLIKSTIENSAFPAKSVVLTHQTTGQSLTPIFQSNKYLMSNNTITNTSQSLNSQITNTTGAHAHHNMNDNTSSSSWSYYRYTQPTHSHSMSLGINSVSLTNFYLKCWTNTTSEFGITPNIIAMYESLTPPDGWVLCNGSNGTPDLRDCFIILGDDGNVGTKNIGNNIINVSGSINSGGAHGHNGSNINWSGSFPYHIGGYGSHSHSVTSQDISFLPPYYALSFIMKAA